MVTMGDLIKQGIIKEYIPPKAGTTKSLKKKPRASPVLQEVFPSVFEAWLETERAKPTRTGSKRKAGGLRKYGIKTFTEQLQEAGLLPDTS